MNKNALLRIREALPSSSSTEASIINYLIRHPEEMFDCSIHQLAARTYSSAATILRLCRKLGFEGYRDFRQSFIYELALQNKNMEEETKDIIPGDSLKNILEKVTRKNMASLENSLQLLDEAEISHAVDLIEQARLISLYGIGSSLLVARDLYLKFLRLNKPCVLNDDWHSQQLQARTCTARDLGIVFSYSGQTHEVITCMESLQKRSCPIISITRYGVSPVAQMADLKLYVADNEALFRSSARSSRISMLNLVDILYMEYFNRNYEAAAGQLKETHIRKT